LSKTSGAVFDFDHIAGMINLISDYATDKYQIGLPKDFREEIVEHVLNHYYDHVQKYTVSVNGSDPYKILAWAGVYIYVKLYKEHKRQAIQFLSCTVVLLNRTLLESGKSLPDWYIKKTIEMVLSEFNGGNHLGLGKNGLYMAFKGASLV